MTLALHGVPNMLTRLIKALVGSVFDTPRPWLTAIAVSVRYNHVLLLGTFVLCAVSFFLSYQLRFDFSVPDYYWRQCILMLPYVAAIKLVLFHLLGGTSTGWRYVGIRDVAFLAFFTAACALVLLGFAFLERSLHIPRGVVFIDFLFSLVLLGGLRISARFVREEIVPRVREIRRDDDRQAIIVGAGDAGEMLIREIRRNPQSGFRVQAFFDDDPAKKGMSIHGVPVKGGIEDVRAYVKRSPVNTALIAIPSADRAQMKRIRDLFRELNISVKTLPRLHEMIEKVSALSQLRDINITDLLGREEIRIDSAQVRELIEGKSVLVTGAGGSIGSELCMQIARRNPSRLVLLDHGENSLFHIHRRLRSLRGDGSGPILVPLLCDLADRRTVLPALRKHKPAVVFHAAAHKHVAMQELNPLECFRNNVGGIRTLTNACIETGVDRFLLISSDKAVNPTSVMGATKRACELYCQALAPMADTQFMSVRFGNVLASEGSVVPLFMEQIEKGGPLTVTHPDVQRYFMTISEAVTLVLQACALGESGRILILEMGEPVRIVDLAHQLVALAGKGGDDIRIEFIGLKPGEKITEQLWSSGETFHPTAHEKIKVITQKASDPEEILARINAAVDLVLKGADTVDVRKVLQGIVPEYKPVKESLLVDFTGDIPHDQSVSGSFNTLPI